MTQQPLVLVIEDNPMNADVLRENLVETGYSFALAVNGAAGVAIANDLLPDIILMDINLPILDGLSATRLLKKNNSTQSIPVIALTARAMAGDQDVCLAAGCDDYVSKPVDIDQLLAKMVFHMDRRPPAFVEMIRRTRSEAVQQSHEEVFTLKPGMAPRDYEEELAALNHALEQTESKLKLSQMRVDELDEALADRERQVADVIAQRDAAADSAQGRINALSDEIDWLRAKGALAIPVERATPEPAHSLVDDPSKNEDHQRLLRRARKLAQQVQLSQDKIEDLQAQIDAVPPDLRTLQSQHEHLRKAFLQLHRSVAKAAEDALHQVAFGLTP